MCKILSFFGTLSSNSKNLGELVKILAAKEGFDFIEYLPLNSTPVVYFKACLQSDAVVVDATIESDINKNIHYGNFNAMHNVFDHIIIVSRSYLPLNFTTLFRDIAPDYPNRYPYQEYPDIEINDAETTIWKNRENQEIIERLTKRLKTINQPPLDTVLPDFDPDNPKSFYEAYTELIKKSIDRTTTQNRNGKRKIFISYRSRHFESVKNLMEQYDKDRYEFTVFRPGTLAYETEILSRLRRWQLISIIDRYIERVDEVWIYDTGDYRDSWWTQGELITLAYRKYHGSYCPEVKTCNPINPYNLTPGYASLPKLTEIQAKKMARLYSNSDPLTMGPETTRNIRIMQIVSDIPFIGTLFYWGLRKVATSQKVKTIMKKYVPSSVITEGAVSEESILSDYANKKFMKEYLHDPVWQRSFSENPVLEYGKKDFESTEFDVDSFISMNALQYKEFTPFKINKYVSCHYYTEGKINFSVKKKAPRYLWYPNRMGRKEKSNLHVLDTVIFNRID